jgi:hypothetical protein
MLDDLSRLLSEKEMVQGDELRDMLARSEPETGPETRTDMK